jgi:ubiquinone/menaquinone biosynthesis C-methylase UbiE
MKDRRPPDDRKHPHPRKPAGPPPKHPRRSAGQTGPKPTPPIRNPQSAIGNPATHWGDVAEWYDTLVGEEGSEYHRQVVLPGAIRLLAAKPGDDVLDIACGQGVLCRMLARLGIQATGVDAAPDLIRMAKDRNGQLEPAAVKPIYHLNDARDLSRFPENHFAAAACLLAIQNLNPINPVFTGVARALKPMGRLVIAMMHPAFRSPKESHWGWDAAAGVQFRRVDRYLIPRKVPIVTNPGKSGDYTWTFHKPIEAYVKALRNAGLLVDALEEWPSHKTSTSGPRAAAENTARKEIPMFLAIRALKVLGPALDAEPEPQASEDPV